MKTRLKRWLAPRRLLRGVTVLAVLVGVAGAAFAAWLVLDQERWFPEISENAAAISALESSVADLQSEVFTLQDQLGVDNTSELSSRLDDLEGTASDHSDRLDSLESRADDTESDTSDLETRLDDVETQATNACSELEFATDYEASC